MSARIIDGAGLAARIRAEVAAEAAALGGVHLATILVGDDAASHVYIDSKHRVASEAGIRTSDYRLPGTTTEDDVLALVDDLNADEDVDALLVQLPLPPGMDEDRITRRVRPIKDVDGFHPVNVGHLVLGTALHVPATPSGCMAILADAGIDPSGRDAVVIGRSQIVGMPMALLLLQANASVTVCHSRTKDLAAHVRRAEIVVSAVGRAYVVTPDMVKPGAAVIDVGMNRLDGKLTGDVDPACAEVAGVLTPVPGGVGPMTIAMLMKGAVKAARYRREILAFPESAG